MQREYFLDNTAVDYPFSPEDSHAFLTALGLHFPCIYEFTNLPVGIVISPNEKLDVAYLETQSSGPEKAEAHKLNVAALDRINIKLTYESVYGEQWTIEMNSVRS